MTSRGISVVFTSFNASLPMDPVWENDYLTEYPEVQAAKKKKLCLMGSSIAVVSVVIFSAYSSVLRSALSATNSGKQPTNTVDGPSGPESGPLYRIELPPPLVCNDNTTAVYYRAYAPEDSPNAKRWIVEFEGGGSCGGINVMFDYLFIL
jgi:hypothetical protein